MKKPRYVSGGGAEVLVMITFTAPAGGTANRAHTRGPQPQAQMRRTHRQTKCPAKCRRLDGAKFHVMNTVGDGSGKRLDESQGPPSQATTVGPLSQPVARYPLPKPTRA
jgi:hypothetical protein